MRRPALPCVTMVIAAIVAATSVPASAQFTPDQLRCRSAVAKAGRKLAKTTLKAITDCHRERNTGTDAIDCNALASADPGNELAQAELKFAQAISGRCEGVAPSDVLYQHCPEPCEDAAPTLTEFTDVSDCLSCLNRARIEEVADAAFGDPVLPLDRALGKCHRSLTTNGSRFLDAILKNVGKCQAAAEKEGATAVTGCTGTGYGELTGEASAKAGDKIAGGACSGPLPDVDLDPCGGASSSSLLSDCVVTAVDAGGKTLVSEFLNLTTTTTTTTTIPVGDPQCPGTAELLLLARDTDQPCTDNADCTLPRTCDALLGHCVSATEEDRGWMGLGHESDTNDGVRLGLKLSCAGPAGPTCGSCDIVGFDPTAGNCRCADDPRQVCDNPFNPHSSDCPDNGACDCYAGPPIPLTTGGTPFCVVQQLAGHPGGTIDVDTGDITLEASLRARVFLGNLTTDPCPTCGGTCSNNPAATCQRDADCPDGTCTLDPIAGDGVRGGTCVNGPSDGLSCDVMATNASLPAFPAIEGGGGGGGYSLDCMPFVGKNVSGFGLEIDLSQSTGSSSLGASVSCQGPGAALDCPCLLCNVDPTLPCTEDADCGSLRGCSSNATYQCSSNSDCASADVGVCLPSIQRCSGWTARSCSVDSDCENVALGTCEPSTCSTRGFGEYPLPNGCEDLLCTDTAGEGECTNGPDDRYCDGVTAADGRGVLACNSNADCAPETVGVDAGACTIVQRRRCFSDPIAATGDPDPSSPLLAGSYCMPPTANAGVNSIVGLPGPARLVQQTTLASRCAGDPMVAYTPGVGGCP